LVQDREAIQKFFPKEIIGLYSSGLGRKIIRKITVAGIQSIYKKAKIFKHFDLVIIDECHVMPSRGMGMFKQFFSEVKGTRVGLSATPFRTGQGYVYEGEGAFFTKISCDLCSMEVFNDLVEKKYLTVLHSLPAKFELDTAGVKTTAGDFNNRDLSQKFDRDSITSAAVQEILKYGKKYKTWLIFAINIEHADNINKELQEFGINSKALHSHTSKDRKKILQGIKTQKLRCVVSVGMVTTGFDAPNIDLIVLLRPTKSPILHVQMIGRGLRTSKESGKDHCLVLDFSGNIKRLGPINNVRLPGVKKKEEGGGLPIIKTCPKCECMHHPSVKVCPACGHIFIFKSKLEPSFEVSEIVQKSSKTQDTWRVVTDIEYSVHRKTSNPDSLKVTYYCGISTVSEYICFGHTGYAKYSANNWVNFRWMKEYIPRDVEGLYNNSKYLRKPKKIKISSKGKFLKVVDVVF